MTHAAERLVGRDAELAQLERLLEDALSGVHKFALVTGEPGIGKTSLLRELTRLAEDRECLVLEGRASELERGLPFGLLVDTFDAYLESLDPRSFDRLAADGLGELASVFPAMRGLAERSDHQPKTPVERFRAYHAVRELIERLAAQQPLVLAFDDLQWGDGASLELLGYLLRRPAQAAVLGVVTMRTGQTSAVLAGTIASGMRSGQIHQIELGPLAPAEARKLVDADGAAELEHLYRQSGGNPFYLLQLARSGGNAGASRDTAGLPDANGVPRAVTAAIAAELDGLDEPVRAFAEAAAVAGDPFELDLVVAAAAQPETEAFVALDELIARDLLRPGDVPRRFQFRHPLVRSAVYASCSPGGRLITHERSAAALAARGAPAILLAHHVEQSARHGDVGAVAVLREAGRASSERAPASAARWFGAALRILPGSAPPAERAELLLALAGSAAATGRLEESRAALLEAIEIAPEDSLVTRVKLITACAGVEQLLGRHTEAHKRLTGTLEGLPDPGSTEAALLMFDLAVGAFYGMDYERMLEWGQRTLDSARALDDRGLTAAAAAISAFACTLRPETISEAHAHHAEAGALLDALPDEDLAKQLSAVAWLAAADFYLDQYAEGMLHAERGLAVARATGQGEFFPTLTQALANLLFSSGRPKEAAELLDGVVESARLSDNAVLLAWSLLNRSFAATYAGEFEDALHMGEEAMELTAGLEGSPVAIWAGGAYARARLELGEPELAREAFMARCGGVELSEMPGAWRVIWLDTSTRCSLALGRRDDAARTATLAGELAAAYGTPLALAVAKRTAAALALEDGDATRAAELALSSATEIQAIGNRVESAVTKTLAGRALAAAGQKDQAAIELEHAAAEFEACGAPRHRDRVEHELRKLGHTVHRRSTPGRAGGEGVDALTGRELEVARLVVDRRTNAEIAGELFLSIKTVETHLRNIFRKLGAGSRVEVARAVERAERNR